MKHQQGFSLSGFIAVAILAAFAAWITMLSVPPWIEYRAIQRIVRTVAFNNKNSPTGFNSADIRKAFDTQAGIDNVRSIEGKDLKIENVGGDPVIAFAYDKKIKLFGFASLLFEFRGGSR
ncbi:MAG: DUF4845 domain-containing protein [Zoogloeaceae bacterium]|jgi:hypothetical protein|nr:DUF4845 domain-containing protein [Zoogloeaceae bacterium]